MTLALLSLSALLAAILISSLRSDMNTGIVAVVLAFLIGVYGAGLGVAEVAAYLPEQLVLTLVGVALLFGMAEHNGTLARVAQYALAASGGHPALLPPLFFLLTFTLSAIGPGNIAAVALLAPIGMTLAVSAGINPLLMAIVICTGANAGAFSPVALTGSINAGLIAQIGVHDPAIVRQIFTGVAALQSLSAVAAYFIFGRYHAHPESPGPRLVVTLQPFNTRHLITLLAILTLSVGVIFFKVSTVVGAFVLAGVLALFKVGDSEASIKTLPWNVIVLVAGISVLIGLIEKTGGLNLATTAIATYASAHTINAALALTTGLVSVYSSSSGVVMPVFIALIPDLIQKLGGGNMIEMIVAVDLGSHMVDVSPLSTLGALCLAALPETVNKARLFRQLLAWGLAMAVVGAGFAWMFLDVL